MKQTAVEWLLENLNSEPYSEEEFNYNSDCWDKAQEMFKQQIVDAFEQGEYTGRGFEDLTSEEYYNINFKSE